MNEKKTDKMTAFTNWLIESIDKFVIVGISILYVVQGLFTITKSDKSLIDILGSILEGFIVGLTVYMTMRRMGIKQGRKSKPFQDSLDLYANVKDETKPFRHKSNAFCRLKNEENLLNAKIEFLEDNGLSYELYEKGFYDDKQNVLRIGLEEYQVKALDEVKNIKVAKIRPRELYSDLPKMSKRQEEKYGMWGKDEKNFSIIETMKDATSMLIFAIVGGYWVLNPIINDKALANAIWNAIQLLIWFGFGLLKYFASYSFMINEYRQSHIIQKTELLNEFISIEKYRPEKLDRYDHEEIYLKQMQEIKEEENNDNTRTIQKPVE